MSEPSLDLEYCEKLFLQYHKRLLNNYQLNMKLNLTQGKKALDVINSGVEVRENIRKISQDNYIVLAEEEETGEVFATLVHAPTQPYYHFSRPIVEINSRGEMKRNYKQITPGDRLYVWATVEDEIITHLSVLVVTKEKKHISFGLGHSEKVIKDGKVGFVRKHFFSKKYSEQTEALLYSPDHIFDTNLFKQLQENTKYIRLVAVTEVTETHVLQLNKEFDTIQKSDLVFGIEAKTVWHPVTAEERLVSRSTMTAELSKIYNKNNYKLIYNLLTNYKTNQIALLFKYYHIKLPLHTYNKYSGKYSGHMTNWSMFLQKLLPGLLHCDYINRFLGMPVGNPYWCRQKFSSAPVSKCTDSSLSSEV
jgi:hypothetical protein